MYCTKCGEQIPDDSRFCPKCGQPVPKLENAADADENKTVSGNGPEAENKAESESKPEAGSGSEAENKAGSESKPESESKSASEAGNQAENKSAGEPKAEEKTENKNVTVDVQITVKTQDQSQSQSQDAGEEMSEKEKLKLFLTIANLERFAPLAAFFPFAMMIVCGIMRLIPFLGKILSPIFGLLFTAAAVGAAIGLCYVAVQFKKKEEVLTWIAPATVVLAAFTCIGQLFGGHILFTLLALATFVMGLDFLVRITIPNQVMESPINIAGDIAAYKKYFQDYKEKNPTTKDLERAGKINPDESHFDGSGLELLGLTILTVLVCVVTCGIAAPWMICKLYKWRLSHTVINGKRLTFEGSGGSLLGHWILWEILTVITCGIYGFFTYVALKKWELSHTYIDGEPVVPGSNASYFDGNSFEFLGYGILGGLLIVVTCGIGTPWVISMIQGWDIKHQVVNGRRLKFSGSGLGFLGEFIIISLLTLVTCGIYQPWGTVRMNKYITRHTDFV